MTDPSLGGPAGSDAGAVVADAIQNLTAARLGRGFVPLSLLFAAGGVGVLRSSGGGWWTALGALVTSAVMLAYGLRTVQRTLGRAHGWWMTATAMASILPPVYGVYVAGWRGLRGLATAGGLLELAVATLFVGMGVCVLRAWMRVVEIERLARVMTLDPEAHGDHG